MFVYLSKKIAIPNEKQLKALSWNHDQGWIACGGEDGLLKVLKLEQVPANGGKGAPTQSNLSMNQTLEGHNGSCNVITWNENYRKLTTSDEGGLIIVWMLHKNMWFEEMINNRNKSVVRDMKWTADGQKICIAYEDGAVIVGSVEGNRLWGQDLTHELAFVEWAPDGRSILFGTPEGKVRIYDNTGNPINEMQVHCLDEMQKNMNSPLAALHWHDNDNAYNDRTATPALCVAYNCGMLQLMRHENDDDPIIVNSDLNIMGARWNPGGTILAVCGTAFLEREIPCVKFYTPHGQHMRTLTIPPPANAKGNAPNTVTAISWDGDGLRAALAVGASIYFANVKPDYKWGYFSNTLVYAFEKDKKEHCVVFWDTVTDEKYTKYVKGLLGIQASGDYCVLAVRAEEADDQYILILCNSIGSPVDSKYINIEPTFLTMSKTHVIACSTESIYVWTYRTQSTKLTTFESQGKRKISREMAFHINEIPGANSSYNKDTYQKPTDPVRDPICCVTVCDHGIFIVGRVSGIVHRYTIPRIELETKMKLRCRPQMLALNLDATKFLIIDINGILSLYDMELKSGSSALQGAHTDFEKKDVWDIKWSQDNPDLFVTMEKTRMVVYRGLDPEAPVITSGHLCEFKDLEIRSVLLDEVMKGGADTSAIKAKDIILEYETSALRKTREVIEINMKDAFNHVSDNPHPRLWRLLSEASLEKLDFTQAEQSFVACEDYQGIYFVKKLRKFDDKMKQRAEVAAYFKRFDEAESTYREMDRKDLALQLRMRLGDWFKVIQLVQQGAGNDELLTLAWNSIGDYFADRKKWSKAASYYSLAGNNEALSESYYRMEDFTNLEKLIEQVTEGDPLLLEIGDKFQCVGMCEAAVEAFVKAGEVKRAVDACVLLNQWNQAVELAEKHNFHQIEGLLTRYANQLLEKNNKMEAIELYRKANRNTEAAKLLAEMALELSKKGLHPLTLKKIYVLAALEVDSYKKRILDAQMTGTGSTAKTLESLITSDISTVSDKALDNPWRGAEAMHFYLMCQRQLLLGQYEDALRTALRLTEYEMYLETKEIYSLIALAAYYNRSYKECSKAFVKLEAMNGVDEDMREAYEEVAMSIFSKHSPIDQPPKKTPCPGKGCDAEVTSFDTHCRSCGSFYPACIASGRSILVRRYYTCKACKHKALENELQRMKHKRCPLCHSALQEQ